jgi:hypothetical protein
MSPIRTAIALAVIASSASAQSSLAACGEPPDSTARQVIVSVGTLKVCLLAMRADPADSTPRRWATRSHLVILETQQPGDFRRLALDRSMAWTVNGNPVAYDSTVESWQRVVIDVVDAAWATRLLRESADDLRATDIPVPTNPDSAKRKLAALDKQIVQLQSKFRVADAEVDRAQRRASGSPSAGPSRSGPERDLADAIAVSKAIQDEMAVLIARKDLRQLQLERLDPTNPRTIAREAAANQVASRLASVEAEFNSAFARLLEILAR